MLYVPAPSLWEIAITDLFDNPVYDGVYNKADCPEGSDLIGKPKPQIQTYRDFLLARLTDEVFFGEVTGAGGKKEGVDALELIELTRRQIKSICKEKAAFQGYDDEVAKRLQTAILHPKQGRLSMNMLYEHNWHEWVQGWKKLHKEVPAVLVTPEPVQGLVEEDPQAAQ
jgi:hypothetical protein